MVEVICSKEVVKEKLTPEKENYKKADELFTRLDKLPKSIGLDTKVINRKDWTEVSIDFDKKWWNISFYVNVEKYKELPSESYLNWFVTVQKQEKVDWSWKKLDLEIDSNWKLNLDWKELTHEEAKLKLSEIEWYVSEVEAQQEKLNQEEAKREKQENDEATEVQHKQADAMSFGNL